jgi:CRISPR-associated endonuclease/helicase Cas3
MNYTEKDILKNDWKYLPLIESITAISALFHDFGKASIFFQEKLKGNKSKIKIKGNPVRHEWVSVLFLVAIVDKKSDEEWLAELALSNNLNNTISKLKIVNSKNPLENLPPVASMVAWLILTHHNMPEIK